MKANIETPEDWEDYLRYLNKTAKEVDAWPTERKTQRATNFHEDLKEDTVDKDKEFEKLKKMMEKPEVYTDEELERGKLERSMASIRGAAKDAQEQYNDGGYLELESALSNLGAHIDIARTQVRLLDSMPKPIRVKSDSDLKTDIQEFPDRAPEVLDYELVYGEEDISEKSDKRTGLLYTIRDAVHALDLHDGIEEVTVHRDLIGPRKDDHGPRWNIIVRRINDKGVEENLGLTILDRSKTSYEWSNK